MCSVADEGDATLGGGGALGSLVGAAEEEVAL